MKRKWGYSAVEQKKQETGKNQRIDFSRFFVSGDFGVQNCIFTSKFLWEKHEFSIELGIWTFESISSC